MKPVAHRTVVPPGLAVTLEDIEAATALVADRVSASPTLPAARLSALVGAEVFVKYENLTATGSFKERGAVVKLASLDAGQRRRGVVAMSAGNHAQAVAYHASALDMPSTIVMPVTTPYVKVAATEGYGARVVLFGETVAEAQFHAEELAEQEGLVFVHPYDDPAVITGQGTLALEMLAAVPDLDVLVVPVGGGGLISGVAVAAKTRQPGLRVVGAEAAAYPTFWNAVHGTALPVGGPTLAEGIAVKNAGALTLPIVRALVDDIVLVSEEHLERAVNAFMTLQKTMTEGAGAAGLAALFADPAQFRGRRVGLVLSGGNIDPRVMANIMLRELEREDRILAISLTISDRPGILGAIATKLGEFGANILEVDHHRMFLDVPAKGARLDIMVECRGRTHADAILAALIGDGYVVRRIDLSNGTA